MNTVPLIIAAAWDIEGLFKLGLLVIFIIGALIKALSNTAKQANPPAKRLPNMQPLRPDPAPEATVQDFLDRVNRQRAEARRAQARPTPAYVEAEVVEADLYGSESVSQHVARHVGTSGLSSRTLSHERLSSDDAAREVQLGKFKHQVGRLSETAGDSIQAAPESVIPVTASVAAVTTADTSAVAAEILNLLRTPQGLRQAVILNEIFNRPEITR